jgi:hypothetical protein|tara:strand:- start:1246 stop:1440 length:195 start_codon:yes stop_codon:yes gene_type:complete
MLAVCEANKEDKVGGITRVMFAAEVKLAESTTYLTFDYPQRIQVNAIHKTLQRINGLLNNRQAR